MIDVLHHARELILSSVNWYVSGWSNPNGNLMVSPRLAKLGVMNRSWTAILNETEAANLGSTMLGRFFRSLSAGSLFYELPLDAESSLARLYK